MTTTTGEIGAAAVNAVEGLRIEVEGTVQGVGFRPWVFRTAQATAVTGRVRNHSGGVTIEAFGPRPALDRFVATLRTSAPAVAQITAFECQPIAPQNLGEFRIVSSAPAAERRISIPADLATCPACLDDITNQANRRYRYAFTTCTHCGPRFTIATAIPYDRPNTTMARFTMCPKCQGEYDAVDDRRFHAQPNACPSCGPTLRLVSDTGSDIPVADAIAAAANALQAGLIVAIKGIGGFHLACDATSSQAVRRLRERKRRDEKPFAVMVPSLEAASRVASLSDAHRELLSSVERPVVLAPRREDAALAPEVAPQNPLIGVFLPYSPLHHLLLAETDRPLVLTSGNLSEEPIAYRNDEALERLAGIADLFLLHDRDIVTRADDSVAQVVGGRPMVLRRSRGYVPRPLSVKRRFSRPVLACGALLKNTFCIGTGTRALIGPHIGDLENLETLRAYEESVERLCRFAEVNPEVVAYDLHPDYMSSRFGRRFPAAAHVGVQHHHAHIAAVMGEYSLEGPVIGVAYDGTGYGTDGAAWGGEILLAEYGGFERLATFRPIALPGGDAAVAQPWRTALSLITDAFDGDAPIEDLPIFQSIPPTEIALVRQMLARRVNTPEAHGLGRYFDAFGALVLNRGRSAHEGQIALEWNLVADRRETSRYCFEVHRNTAPWTIDLRPAVRDAVFELLGGERASVISARFHNTVECATAAVVRDAARRYEVLPVVLGGGCFQNALLTEGIVRRLERWFSVYVPSVVPPGDGGISFGQALVANAVLNR